MLSITHQDEDVIILLINLIYETRQSEIVYIFVCLLIVYFLYKYKAKHKYMVTFMGSNPVLGFFTTDKVVNFYSIDLIYLFILNTWMRFFRSSI